MSARDIIALALCRANARGICSEDCTGFDKPYCVAAVSHGEDADAAIAALTAAGYSIAPPGARVVPEGAVDAETVQKCAVVADQFDSGCGDQLDRVARIIAAALRALAETAAAKETGLIQNLEDRAV